MRGSVVTSEPLLSLHRVSVRFGGVAALTDLDLSVDRGEAVGIIGPNGAGKSTTLNVLSGFVAPNSGDIRLCGSSIRSMPPHIRAHSGIGRTFQTPRPFEGLTTRASIDIVRRSRPRRPHRRATVAQVKRWIDEQAILDACNCTQFADIPAERLTGGQRRFAELARCLALDPDVVLMDEPATGLREVEIDQLATIIKMLSEHHRIATLIVSHDMRLINDACTRVIAFDYGSIMAEGTPGAVRNDPQVIASYLGENALG